MSRAPKICGDPSCPNLQPCPDHAPQPWDGSNGGHGRYQRTVSGSAQQKRAARIMRRYERTCHVCGRPMADQVDHVIPLAEGGADDDSNLRPIHARPCHIRKTLAEARRAKGLT